MSPSKLSSFPPGTEAFIQGASRGLGLAFTRALLDDERVARVFACSRNAQTSDALQSLLREHGERLVLVDVDVTREPTIAAAARAVGERAERLHLVCNVAGLLHDEARDIAPEKRLDDLDPDGFLELMRVNALGPALVAKHLAPLLRHPQRAVIANISARVGSIADNRLGGWYSYRASKAAQNMLTRTMAIEFGTHRRMGELICVALHPGTVDTDLSRPFQAHVPAEKLFDVSKAVDQLLKVIDGLRVEDSGRFFAWDGAPIEW